jgi:hypothetical protein
MCVVSGPRLLEFGLILLLPEPESPCYVSGTGSSSLL